MAWDGPLETAALLALFTAAAKFPMRGFMLFADRAESGDGVIVGGHEVLRAAVAEEGEGN